MKYGIRYNPQGWWVYEVATNTVVSGPHYYKWVAQNKCDHRNERA